MESVQTFKDDNKFRTKVGQIEIMNSIWKNFYDYLVVNFEIKWNFLVVNDSYVSVKTFKTFREFWLKVGPSNNLTTYKSKINYIISVNLYQSAFDSEAKDLESAESIQYKKTMLHRYLNDAIEVSNATACSRESEVLVTNKPESSKGQIISEGNCGVVPKFSLSKNPKLY